MRIALCALFASALAAQNPQAESVARQREAIERQRAALDAQNGPHDLIRQSVEKQRASVLRQAGTAAESPPLAAAVDCAQVPTAALDPMLDRAAQENSLSSDLLRAVIRRESGFNPCAVSRAGAMGLMQLMPATAGDLLISNPFDPEQNILGGSRLLRSLLDRYGGDLPLALGAYNAGPRRVDESGGIPPIRETQDYVRSILDLIVR